MNRIQIDGTELMEHLMQDGPCGSCSASKGGHGIMCNLNIRSDLNGLHQVREVGPDTIGASSPTLLTAAGVEHEESVHDAIVVQIMRIPVHIVLDCGEDFSDQLTWHERAVSCKVPACGAVCSIEC